MNSPSASSPFLGLPSAFPRPDETGAWTVELDVEAFPFLADHRLRGAVVLPGAAAIEMALAAVTAATGLQTCVLDDVRFDRVCVLPTSGARLLRVALQAGPAGDFMLTVSGEAQRGPATPHATARVTRYSKPGGAPPDTAARASQVRRAGTEIPKEDFYDNLHAVGNNYGPAFRSLQHLWRDADEAVALIRAESAIPADHRTWLAHPVVVDAAIQLVAAAAGVVDRTFVWTGCERVRLIERLPVHVQAYARTRHGNDADQRVGDVLVLGSTGQVIAEITGVRLHLLRAGTSRHPGGQTATVFSTAPVRRRDDDSRVRVDNE